MKIRFDYTVSQSDNSNVLQHSPTIEIEVPGEPEGKGEGPSIEQLVRAEREFLAEFDLRHPGRYLIKFTSGPADGTTGRYSEYRAFLPAT